MAGKTDLRLRPFHLYREARLVAFVALLVLVWRMRDKSLFRRRGLIGLSNDELVEGLAVLVVLNLCRIRGGAGRGHAVKEEAKPFLFLLRGAANNASSDAEGEEG